MQINIEFFFSFFHSFHLNPTIVKISFYVFLSAYAKNNSILQKNIGLFRLHVFVEYYEQIIFQRVIFCLTKNKGALKCTVEG